MYTSSLRLSHVQQLRSQNLLPVVFCASIATVQVVQNLVGGCADLTICIKKDNYIITSCAFFLKGPGVVELICSHAHYFLQCQSENQKVKNRYNHPLKFYP